MSGEGIGEGEGGSWELTLSGTRPGTKAMIKTWEGIITKVL